MSTYDGLYPIIAWKYQVLSGANAIRCDDNTGGSPTTTTIPAGAYLSCHPDLGDGASICGALQTALQTADVAINGGPSQVEVTMRLDGRVKVQNPRWASKPFRILWTSGLTTLPLWVHGYSQNSSNAFLAVGHTSGAMLGGQWHAGEPPMRVSPEFQRLVTKVARTYTGRPVYLPHLMPGSLYPTRRTLEWVPLPSARISDARCELEEYRAAAGWSTALGWTGASGGEGQNRSTLERLYRYASGHGRLDPNVGFEAENNRPVYVLESAIPMEPVTSPHRYNVHGPYYLDVGESRPGGMGGIDGSEEGGEYAQESYPVKLVLWRDGE